MTVGERIRNKRIELGMTQEELAEKMGYSGKSTICKAETCGDNITTVKVKKYADALGCSFDYLMGWEIAENIRNDATRDARILKIYHQLNDNDKSMVDSLLENLLSHYEK